MPEAPICKIDECGNPCWRTGYCRPHYLRLRKYGDPLAGGSFRPRGHIPCAIEGCTERAYSRGWCVRHYQRWRKHGDPLEVKLEMAEKGEPWRFFTEVLLPYRGEECIAWPYAKTPAGYGQVWKDGRLHVVSRLICEYRHGPPPEPEYDAAHSCGNGHLACSNPSHLSWKTRLENVADMIGHGTARFWGNRQK